MFTAGPDGLALWTGKGLMPTFGDTGGETAMASLSVKSWTLCLRAKQSSMLCPGAFICYAQRACRS